MKFYKLSRVYNPDQNNFQPTFLLETGEHLSHPEFDLVVYRAKDEDKKPWYVVERSSGCAFVKGTTKNDAIFKFEDLWKHHPEKCRKGIKDSIEHYGRTPDHKTQEVY